MVLFPNAKINLGLHILAKRPDGYHDLETCMYPIPWYDVLEIVPAASFSFVQTGLNIPSNDNNICISAYHLIKERYDIAPVSIHLHKVIPMGAGLGGGSADAAFTLKMLNELFSLKLNSEQLKEYAGQLGSDCAFFIDNMPAIATKTGTELELFPLNLSNHCLAVIYPEVHISTAQAYAVVTPTPTHRSLKDILFNLDNWQSQLKNDFEQSIFTSHPVLRIIKEDLYSQGAFYAAMSGSGSAVFSLFEKSIPMDHFSQYNWIQQPLIIR